VSTRAKASVLATDGNQDNAAMIAWAAMHRFLAGDTDSYDVDTRNVWSVEDIPDAAT
jgi:tRNA A37 threonylcarbamoyltransferase TsaD